MCTRLYGSGLVEPSEGKLRDLFKAVWDHDHSRVRELLDPDTSSDEDVRALVNAQAYANSIAPLCSAVDTGDEEMVGILLAAGADPNQADPNGEYPIHRAVMRGYDTIVLGLLAADADANAIGYGGATPLHVAAQHDRIKIAQHLLDAGADINARVGRSTALSLATSGEMTELLKRRGAIRHCPLPWNSDVITMPENL